MDLKVISFNIRCCDDPDGHSIAERAPRLYKVTSRYDADILAFQEYRRAWEPQIEKYYGEKYDMFLKYRNETEDVEASPILWKRDKFTLKETGYFWLSDTPDVESRGWDELYNCYRMCVWVRLRDKQTGVEFIVMNTHFGFGDEGQVKSAQLILKRKEKISGLPTLIAGDFNMTPQGPAYSEMLKHFCDINAETAKNFSKTFHNYHPETESGQHIDYCFIDGGMTAHSQILIDETVDGKFPSDHYGLYSIVRI